MVNYIFPYIALYRAMIGHGYDKEEAYRILYTTSENSAWNTMRKMYVKAGRLPCDEINFNGVSKHLYFRRNQTPGNGGTCCDFHFYKNDPDQ